MAAGAVFVALNVIAAPAANVVADTKDFWEAFEIDADLVRVFAGLGHGFDIAAAAAGSALVLAGGGGCVP